MGKQESISDWFQTAKDFAKAESEKRLEELVKRKNNIKN